MRIITSIALASILLATTAKADDVDLTKLTEALGSDQAKARLDAADDLGALGSSARAAVPALIKALSDKDAAVQWHAARAIGSIGPGAKAAVGALTTALASDDAKLRTYAAFALGRIGKPSEPAIPALVKAITDKEDMVQRAAIGAIRNIDADPEIVRPLIIKALEDADSAVAMAAVRVLAETADEKSVPGLIEALKHKEACYWACLVIHELGPAAKDAALPVSEVLKHADPEVRLQAAMTLAAIGPDAKPAVPALVKILQDDPQDGVKFAAGYALGSIGSKDDGAGPALVEAAKGEDPFLRIVGIWGLNKVLPGNEVVQQRAVKMYVEGLKSKDKAVRKVAARAVADSDIPFEVRAPILVGAIKDEDPEVIGHVVGALAAMGAKIAPRTAEALKDKDLRPHALNVLYLMGPEAAPAVPGLIDVLKDNDCPDFQTEVQFTLGRIGPAAAEAVPMLVGSLASKDEKVRNSACYALAKIGPKAEAAVAPLTKMLASEDTYIPMVAAWTLVQIKPDDDDLRKQVMPLLISAVQNAKRVIGRIEVANLLGAMGANAKPAVPALQKALQDDESAAVRDAAAKALKLIEG